jgi:energy-converting hydrogenase A subunit M
VVLKKNFHAKLSKNSRKARKEKSVAIQLCVLSDLCGHKKVSRKACKEFTQNSQRKTLAIQLCVLSDLCGLKKKFHAKLAKDNS